VGRNIQVYQPTPAAQAGSDQAVKELLIPLKKEVVVTQIKLKSKVQIGQESMGQVGGSKNDTAVAVLAVTNTDATGGQVNIGETKVKQFAEPNAGMSQSQEPGTVKAVLIRGN
jgi:hypothetical protein